MRALGTALAALVLATISSWACSAGTPTGPVHTAQGDVTGVAAGTVESFKGIPYAAPPVGELRWRPPAPGAKWTGVKAAEAFGPACMQPVRTGFGPAPATSEDCLTLNVWRPAQRPAGAKLPVMLWIHGGAFVSGSGGTPFYDGTHFAEHGVVIVTINYRLGRFGFFAHPALDGGAGPVGNYGLMDQIAALKWVQANIAAFGGDATNVTVFGESAGAISVNYLVASPAARGLFAKAIAESGFGRATPYQLKGARSAEQVGEFFATGVGIKGEDAAAAAALRALTADQVNAPYGGLSDPNMPSPMVDGVIVKETIARAFANGHQAHVPFMEGGNSYEASLFPQVGDNPDPVIARAGDRAKVLALYGNADPAKVARDLTTDSMITEPTRYLAAEMDKAGVPSFVYHFSYVPAAQRATAFGAPHGGEISYVFDNLRDTAFSFGTRTFPAATADDHKISDAMIAYWVAFAKTGDPGSAGGVAWPRYTVKSDQLLEFGADGVEVRQGFEKARLDFLEVKAEAPPVAAAGATQ
ncbi:MAG: carboxylesterase/lipase family protein [Caulobacterales bacterium]